MTSRRALICGVSGQDGAYLARLLLEKGYEVWGTSRDAELTPFGRLHALGIREPVVLRTTAPNDFRSVLQTLVEAEPDEVYHLAGQSSVGLSFHLPVESHESIDRATLNLLEAIRFLGRPIRFYNACSSECFGEMPAPADEGTPFRPRSPYAVAKAASFWTVQIYREAYGLFAGSGILFNHDSPLRPRRFVTRKVVSAACRIAAGSGERLSLGDLSVIRDWGSAPEYVDAMWRILQAEAPGDYVVATGVSHPLEAFVEAAFAEVGLDWREHVDTDPALFRPNELREARANPARAAAELGWSARDGMRDVVRRMVAAEGRSLTGADDG